MKRSTLSADQANWLAQTFDRNRARFGGMRMMADGPAPKPDPKPDDAKPSPTDDGFKSEDSKARVLADLAGERDARKALERDLENLKNSLGEALGFKPEKNSGGEDVLVAVQTQLAAIQHESAVLRLANEHSITDKDDLELLGSAKDPEAMNKLAARLAAKATEDDGKPKPGPRPDLSQGPKPGDPPRETLPGVPRMAQAFEDAINTH